MFKKLLITLFISVNLSPGAFGFDWKPLHEKADSLSIKEVQEIVENNPEPVENLYLLGLVYLNAHKDQKAKETFLKILDIKEDMVAGRWGLAESLRRFHQSDKAQKILEEIIEQDPQFWPAYISLGYIKYLSMDFDAAVELVYEAVKQGSAEVDASNLVRANTLVAGSKGMIAHYGGPISKIINGRSVMPYLQKAKKIDPDAGPVLFGFGCYYLLAPALFGKDLDKAQKYLKKAIETDPLFVNAYVRLAQVYKAKGDKEQYQKYLDKASSIDPDNEFLVDIKSGQCNFICVESFD